MVAHTDTQAPDGKPFKLTHRRVRTGKMYRIVESDILHISDGRVHYLLANENGVLFIATGYDFDNQFEYVPGGQ